MFQVQSKVYLYEVCKYPSGDEGLIQEVRKCTQSQRFWHFFSVIFIDYNWYLAKLELS